MGACFLLARRAGYESWQTQSKGQGEGCRSRQEHDQQRQPKGYLGHPKSQTVHHGQVALPGSGQNGNQEGPANHRA